MCNVLILKFLLPPKVVAISLINNDYLLIKFLEIFVQFYFGFISRRKKSLKSAGKYLVSTTSPMTLEWLMKFPLNYKKKTTLKPSNLSSKQKSKNLGVKAMNKIQMSFTIQLSSHNAIIWQVYSFRR